MKDISLKFKKTLFLNLLSLIFVTTFIFIQNANAQKNKDELEKKLTAAIDSFYTTLNVPGITAGIWTPEFTYKKAVGKADISTGAERTLEDKIRIGSITKTFVATVILQLIDEGKFGLDDKLSKFYPGFPNSDNITFRQILDMTSGIHDYLEDPLILESFFYKRLNKFTPQELYDATIALPPYFPPGKGWEYSNGNYNILGMLIEKLTGNKIEDEINRRIIQPLGLVNTSYPVTPDMPLPYSHGYMKDTVTGEKIDVTLMDPSIGWAAGCMISTIDDLKIYGRALATGTMLSSNMQRERLKFVKTGVVDFITYGLGIFDLGGFIGHNGGITGYNTTMGYDPELDALIIVSVNEFGPKGGISDNVFTKLADIIYPGKNFFK